MSLLYSIALFIAGIISLLIGSELLINSSSSIARKFGLSERFIGLTLVALGTSLPELSSSLYAVLKEDTGLPLGTVVGSNAFNIGVIVGLSALIFAPSKLKKPQEEDWVFLTLSSLIMLLFAIIQRPVVKATPGIPSAYLYIHPIPRYIFAVLFTFTFLYLACSTSQPEEKHPSLPLTKSIALLVFSIILIFLGSKASVDSIESLSSLLGLSTTFLGILLMATASSLPELFSSFIALHQKKSELALGNITGSCIINFYLIACLCGIFKPLVFSSIPISSYIFLLLLTISYLIFTTTGRKLSRLEGLALLIFYALFLFTNKLS